MTDENRKMGKIVKESNKNIKAGGVYADRPGVCGLNSIFHFFRGLSSSDFYDYIDCIIMFTMVQFQEVSTNSIQNSVEKDENNPNEIKEEIVHVRAKRGQATNSHSLAERVRFISHNLTFLSFLAHAP
jgi:hypothetical protein